MNLPIIGIEFGGGKESMKLVKKLKKYNPILFFYAFQGIEGIIPVLERWAELEGLKLVIIKGKNDRYTQHFDIEKINENGKTVEVVKGYDSPCLRVAKQYGVSVLYNGRRRVDFENLKDVHLPESLCEDGIEVKFPFWYVEET